MVYFNGAQCHWIFFFPSSFFLEVWSVYNVLSISGAQHNVSVIHISHCILFAAYKGVYPILPKTESEVLNAVLKRIRSLILYCCTVCVDIFFFTRILVLEIIVMNQILEGKKTPHNYPFLLFGFYHMQMLC